MSSPTKQIELHDAPSIGLGAGPVMQDAIAKSNLAYLQLLRTAALMGPAEPLAPALLDMPESIIAQFVSQRVVDRMMDLSFGFPLVVGRIRDPQVFAHIVASGSGDAAGIAALTKTLNLEVVQRTTKRRQV